MNYYQCVTVVKSQGFVQCRLNQEFDDRINWWSSVSGRNWWVQW